MGSAASAGRLRFSGDPRPPVAAGRRAHRHRLLGRSRHRRRGRLDPREGRDPLRVHRRPRPGRRGRHRRHPRARARLRRRGGRDRRLPGQLVHEGLVAAPVRRVPHLERRQDVLQHDAARARRHRDDARPRDARARRRHLGRRLDLQGQRHRAVLPLRPARQPCAPHLQAVARRAVRRGARRPQGDERVAAGARTSPTAPRARRRTRPTRTSGVRPTRPRSSSASTARWRSSSRSWASPTGTRT